MKREERKKERKKAGGGGKGERLLVAEKAGKGKNIIQTGKQGA